MAGGEAARDRPWLVVVNPRAGHGRCGRRAGGLANTLRRHGVRFDLVTTREPGHATELARAGVEGGTRGLVAVGGDGTAYEVLNGALAPATDRAPHIAVVPFGTGNSLIRDLAPGGAAQVIDAIASGRARRCDVLRLTATGGDGEPVVRFVFGNCSLGFPATVAELTNRRLKGLGVLGYTAAVLVSLFRLGTIDVHLGIDGAPAAPGERCFVCCNNNVSFGGTMRIAPGARIDDGLLDLVEVSPLSRFELLRAFPRVFRGTHTSHPAVTVTRARMVRFAAPGPMPVLLDGEIETLRPLELAVVPAAVGLVL